MSIKEQVIEYVRRINNPKDLAFLLEIVSDVYQTEGMEYWNKLSMLDQYKVIAYARVLSKIKAI